MNRKWAKRIQHVFYSTIWDRLTLGALWCCISDVKLNWCAIKQPPDFSEPTCINPWLFFRNLPLSLDPLIRIFHSWGMWSWWEWWSIEKSNLADDLLLWSCYSSSDVAAPSSMLLLLLWSCYSSSDVAAPSSMLLLLLWCFHFTLILPFLLYHPSNVADSSLIFPLYIDIAIPPMLMNFGG